MTATDFFTHLEPDPIGVLLNTGYMRFQSIHGIDGLVKVSNDRIDILAVVARVPGQGSFRRFVEDAKQIWSTIAIWEIMEPGLHAVLQRYGFEKASMTDPFGCDVLGYAWRRK